VSLNRKLDVRTRWAVGLLAVAVFVLGRVTDSTASLLIQAALVIVAAVVLVIGYRRAGA
jgi:hypothetical protein